MDRKLASGQEARASEGGAATNPTDVSAKALPGNRIRELCRLTRVYVCCSEEIDSCAKGFGKILRGPGTARTRGMKVRENNEWLCDLPTLCCFCAVLLS